MPLIFGFTCYTDSLDQAKEDGKIPYPDTYDVQSGGHAVLMVGYDDDIAITNTYDYSTTVGAFVIRNSWGEDWGNKGIGYIPYDYLLHGKLRDIWCLVRMDYLNESRFD